MPRPEPVTPLSNTPGLRMERPFTPQSPIRPVPRRQSFPAPGASSGPSVPLMPGPGFTLVLAQDASASTVSGDELERPRDVANELRRCWQAPSYAARQEITIRLAFNRDGSVLGDPRVTYIRRELPEAQKRILRASLISAVSACTPLRFTQGLASAIAGRPIAIRFIVPAGGAGN
ncbi:MAG: hypothetical protein FJX29_13400 [Alphaproteobacteria bacterium]|nr:hypothetical protein [Alphaproteobacteria bacterium]